MEPLSSTPIPPGQRSISPTEPSGAAPASAPPAISGELLAIKPGPEASKRERLAWIIRANEHVINAYVDQAFSRMPPLVAAGIGMLGKALGLDLRRQSTHMLLGTIAYMSDDEFMGLWSELGKMLQWAGRGRDRAAAPLQLVSPGPAAASDAAAPPAESAPADAP